MLVEKYKHANIPIMLDEFLMKGRVTTAFTGRQSSGKTTSMIGSIAFVDPRLPIRTAETSYELFLREVYQGRNIFGVAQTPYTTITELQDALKKSDAALTIIGEVATDLMAARMISLGMVATMFTLFSHHAITTAGLVYALRNSLMAVGGYSDERIAEAQVLEVVKMDVHLDFDVSGNRFVDRITQIIPLAERGDLPQYNTTDPVNSINKIFREYFVRKTCNTSFKTRDIMRFNKTKQEYEPCEWFTPTQTSNILNYLEEEDAERFAKFAHEYWGV